MVATFPVTHDPEARELLAAWRVIRRRVPYEWDAEAGMSRFRPEREPGLAPLSERLRAAGLDPDAVDLVDHSACVERLEAGAARWTVDEAADAFTASLWSAPGAWRSMLPAVLFARAMPAHELMPWSEDSAELCAVCGWRAGRRQLVEEWASRMSGTTPLDGDPAAAGFALRAAGEGRPSATESDRWMLGAVRAVIKDLPPQTRHARAAAAIRSAKLFPLDRYEAVGFLETLALIGVLAPPERPGLAERFTTYRERDQRPNVRVEPQAPLAWWDTGVGDRGWRDDVFAQLFGFLDIPEVDLGEPRPRLVPPAKETIPGGLSARMRALTPASSRVVGSVGDGPAAQGDVWALRVRPDAWVTVYVHEIMTTRDRPYAKVEFLAGVFPEMPDASVLTLVGQPRASGRDVQHVHSLEKTPWVRRVAQGAPTPRADEALPERGPWQAAKELKHLASWHFDEL
ncbi:hypothetical protein [Microbacterium sp.]|uniref:hypothetical protein n=1 Tax=Microbacterium sp. TaxID=51671 RepID=UPI0033417DC8